jgi:hypothetical protein
VGQTRAAEKQKEGGGRLRWCYKQATPSGVCLSQLAGGKNGGRTASGHAPDSIDFQGIPQLESALKARGISAHPDSESGLGKPALYSVLAPCKGAVPSFIWD